MPLEGNQLGIRALREDYAPSPLTSELADGSGANANHAAYAARLADLPPKNKKDACWRHIKGIRREGGYSRVARRFYGLPPLRKRASLCAENANHAACAARLADLPPPKKKTNRLVRLFLWWGKVDSNHRSVKQQIYSLSPLATREFPQTTDIILHKRALVKGFFEKSRQISTLFYESPSRTFKA